MSELVVIILITLRQNHGNMVENLTSIQQEKCWKAITISNNFTALKVDNFTLLTL